MRRFSILGLMGFVLVVCVGLAALRNASELWAGIMLLVALGATGTALLGILYQRGNDRAWWVGFGLFSGGYLTLTFAPWFADQILPRLGTTEVLEYVHFRVTGQAVPLREDVRGLQDEVRMLQTQQIQISNRLKEARRVVRNPNDPSLVRLDGQIARLDGQTAALNARIDSIQGYAMPNSAITSATSAPPAPPSTNRWQTMLPGAANYDQFLRVGHSLFTILAGSLGAMIACHFYRRQEGRPVADVNGGAGLPEAGHA
jgi:hypothetical protein